MQPLLAPFAGGRLVWRDAAAEPGAEHLPEALRKRLGEAFGRSTGEGLLELSKPGPGALPASLAYGARVGREYLTRLCRLPGLREEGWKEGPAASEELVKTLVMAAPPLPGYELVDAAFLRSVWDGLNHAVAARAEAGVSVTNLLAELNPSWRLVGRVTLHLAENRRSPEFPFAFLATYSHGLDARGHVRHLPLAQALKESAASKDEAGLRSLLEPLREGARRSEWLNALVETKEFFHPLAWTPEEAWNFLRESPLLTEAGLVVKVPDWWSKKGGKRPKVLVTVEAKKEGETENASPANPSSGGSYLKFNIDVAMGDTPLTPEEIEKLLACEAPLISLKGEWIELDRHKLRQALDHWKRAAAASANGVPFLTGLRWLSGGPLAVQGGAEEVVAGEGDGWVEFASGPALEAMLKSLRDPANFLAEDFTVPGMLATLRPYQRDGVRWLHQLGKLGLGACLADDMGLGKTLQIIAFLLLRNPADRPPPESPSPCDAPSGLGDSAERIPRALPWAEEFRPVGAGEAADFKGEAVRPSLLVVPASLLGNWTRELGKFAPGLPWLIAHPSALEGPARRKLQDGTHPALKRHGLILTTYTMLGRLPALLENEWDAAILDEAQAIKNAGTGQSRVVRQLRARVRVAMTGTPVENRLTDLWSLFDFLNPGLLGSPKAFQAACATMSESDEGFGPLRRLVKPFLLRRLKTDPGVAPDLPPKTEVNAYCHLTKRQAALYQRALRDLKRELAEAGEDKTKRGGVILGSLLRFKQICNHPSLFNGDAVYAQTDSGKFSRLREIAEGVADRREKMLIFSQFREMTDPLAEFLAEVFGAPGLILHGGTPVEHRPRLVERFQADEGPPFFVISLKAGGTGLNLTAASHVVHFDRWWNPAVEDQATDRAFRIGQKRAVLVHKFVCEGTMEERIDALIAGKRELAADILSAEGSAVQMLNGLGDEELLDLMRLEEAAGE